MAQMKTLQGDTWDMLAFRAYGNEKMMDVLIKANFEHRDVVVFSHGTIINVPDIDLTSSEFESNLPPWKQSGGE